MHKIVDVKGFEVWAHYVYTADGYELFASEDASDYIGCADTLAEARQIGRDWVAQRVKEEANRGKQVQAQAQDHARP